MGSGVGTAGPEQALSPAVETQMTAQQHVMNHQLDQLVGMVNRAEACVARIYGDENVERIQKDQPRDIPPGQIGLTQHTLQSMQEQISRIDQALHRITEFV